MSSMAHTAEMTVTGVEESSPGAGWPAETSGVWPPAGPERRACSSWVWLWERVEGEVNRMTLGGQGRRGKQIEGDRFNC